MSSPEMDHQTDMALSNLLTYVAHFMFLSRVNEQEDCQESHPQIRGLCLPCDYGEIAHLTSKTIWCKMSTSCVP